MRYWTTIIADRSVIACDSEVRKGDELGWFQHGSTIIVFAPDGFALVRQCPRRRDALHSRMGQTADCGSALEC